MSPQFETWKAKLKTLPGGTEEFEKWFFVAIAGVLFGEKAGELLVLCSGQFGLSLEKQTEHIETLSPVWDFFYCIVCSKSSCVTIVIYDRERVQKNLSEVSPWVYDQIGYPQIPDPTEFLEIVKDRCQIKGYIPDEIGIFIGYPIKDVLGFMGLLPLPCTGKCGWRIYGNPIPSILRSLRFRKAQEKATAFLEM